MDRPAAGLRPIAARTGMPEGTPSSPGPSAGAGSRPSTGTPFTWTPFTWVPGEGPDAAALDRLVRAFPRPVEPMGEAWFMGAERRMFPRLLDPLEGVPDGEILKALEEIASGTVSFGPDEEWSGWFLALLPRLIGRRWERTTFQPAELLITAFMVQYPSPHGRFPREGFLAAVVGTLGRAVMSPAFWPGGRFDAVRCLGKRKGPNGLAGWSGVGGLLSASLFLCGRYLPTDRVEPWFRSVLSVPDGRWRMQVATWLIGAHPVLVDGVHAPAGIEDLRIGWSWSHLLGGPLLPVGNRQVLVRMARAWDAEAALAAFRDDPDTRAAAAEVPGLPEGFRQLYGEG